MARKATLVGAQAAKGLFRFAGLPVNNKAEEGYDPVTEADRASEQAMRSLIAAHFPGDTIEGEEFGQTGGKSGWHWYLDPIDGTRSFIAGIPVWTTLVGLSYEENVRFGCLAQPILGELYEGDGSMAHFVGPTGEKHTLSVSGCSQLNEARFATTDPALFTGRESGAYEQLRSQVCLCRFSLDGYAYARLASGTIDLVVESGLKAHDVAALIPIMTGAGGVVTDWRGNRPGLGGQIIAAASPALLEQALGYLCSVSDTV